MEKEIVFTNGERITVSIEIANIIRDRILEGCKNFQCFIDGKSGNIDKIINLNEVSFIY